MEKKIMEKFQVEITEILRYQEIIGADNEL